MRRQEILVVIILRIFGIDTVGDWRFEINSVYFKIEYCAVAGATKGSGTWVTKTSIPA